MDILSAIQNHDKHYKKNANYQLKKLTKKILSVPNFYLKK